MSRLLAQRLHRARDPAGQRADARQAAGGGQGPRRACAEAHEQQHRGAALGRLALYMYLCLYVCMYVFISVFIYYMYRCIDV